MVNSGASPNCNDSRKCFAMRFVHGGFRVCNILTSTYEHDGRCPFCKADKNKVQNHETRGDE